MWFCVWFGWGLEGELVVIHILRATLNHVEGISKVCSEGYWDVPFSNYTNVGLVVFRNTVASVLERESTYEWSWNYE